MLQEYLLIEKNTRLIAIVKSDKKKKKNLNLMRGWTQEGAQKGPGLIVIEKRKKKCQKV